MCIGKVLHGEVEVFLFFGLERVLVFLGAVQVLAVDGKETELVVENAVLDLEHPLRQQLVLVRVLVELEGLQFLLEKRREDVKHHPFQLVLFARREVVVLDEENQERQTVLHDLLVLERQIHYGVLEFVFLS